MVIPLNGDHDDGHDSHRDHHHHRTILVMMMLMIRLNDCMRKRDS